MYPSVGSGCLTRNVPNARGQFVASVDGRLKSGTSSQREALPNVCVIQKSLRFQAHDHSTRLPLNHLCTWPIRLHRFNPLITFGCRRVHLTRAQDLVFREICPRSPRRRPCSGRSSSKTTVCSAALSERPDSKAQKVGGSRTSACTAGPILTRHPIESENATVGPMGHLGAGGYPCVGHLVEPVLRWYSAY